MDLRGEEHPEVLRGLAGCLDAGLIPDDVDSWERLDAWCMENEGHFELGITSLRALLDRFARALEGEAGKEQSAWFARLFDEILPRELPIEGIDRVQDWPGWLWEGTRAGSVLYVFSETRPDTRTLGWTTERDIPASLAYRQLQYDDAPVTASETQESAVSPEALRTDTEYIFGEPERRADREYFMRWRRRERDNETVWVFARSVDTPSNEWTEDESVAGDPKRWARRLTERSFIEDWENTESPSTDTVRQWRAEFSRLGSGRPTGIPPTAEERKKLELAADLRRDNMLRTAAESSAAFSRSSCRVCGSAFDRQATVVRIHGDHIVHEHCIQVGMECRDCEWTRLSGFTPRANRPLMNQEIVAYFGHGGDSGSSTFVPQGMTVGTYAEPGRALNSTEATRAIANPRLAEVRAVFREGSIIPNVCLLPLDPWMQARDFLALDDTVPPIGGVASPVRSLATAESLTGGRPAGGTAADETLWIAQLTYLCNDPEGCKPPFHECKGLLRTVRGVEKLLLGVCLGEIPGRAIEPIDEAYLHLADLVMEAGKKDPLKALALYHEMPGGRRAILLGMDKFYAWYTATMTTHAPEAVKSEESEEKKIQNPAASAAPDTFTDNLIRPSPGSGISERRIPICSPSFPLTPDRREMIRKLNSAWLKKSAETRPASAFNIYKREDSGELILIILRTPLPKWLSDAVRAQKDDKSGIIYSGTISIRKGWFGSINVTISMPNHHDSSARSEICRIFANFTNASLEFNEPVKPR